MLGFSLLILSITIHTIDSFYYRKPDLEPTGIQIKRDIKKKLIYEENQRSRAEHHPNHHPGEHPHQLDHNIYQCRVPVMEEVHLGLN